MKFNPTYLVIPAVGLVFAGVALQSGVAYAETPLAQGDPSKFETSSTYTVDAMHTFTGFEIGHLGLSKVQGRFDKLSGSLAIDSKDISKSKVQINIQANSIDTNVASRDEDLRSANFFDVAKYPDLTFVSTKIKQSGKSYTAVGNLTIKGVTKPVTIHFKKYGPIKDPWGLTRIGVVADPLVIKRSDYGMTFDADSVANEVTIKLSLEATENKAK